VANPKFLETLVAHMISSSWPRIIYPRLPWGSISKAKSLLSFIPENQITGFNLDSILIGPEVPRIGRSDYWAAENVKSSWLEKVEAGLSFPISPNKPKRNTTDAEISANIENSVGLIIPPQEREVGTWWNYTLFQALNTGTPVVTQWQDTISFDSSWGKLGYQIEDMSPAERVSVAAQQRSSYLAAIPTKLESQEHLRNLLIESNLER
jgi:hypothetical protein